MADESIGQIISRIKNQKVREWEVYFQNSVSHQIFLRRNKIELTQNTDTLGCSIRVHDGGIGFATSNMLNSVAIDNSIKNALSIAKMSKKVEFQFPPNQKTKKVKTVDKKLKMECATNTLASYSSQLIDLVRDNGVDVSFAKLKAFDIKTEIINSEGLEKSKRETYFYIELSLKVEREFWTSSYIRRIKDLPMKKITEWIELAKRTSNAVEPKTEKITVILTPKVMVDAFVPVIGFHCVASALKRKISLFLHNKNISSKIINIVDDGLYPFGLNTSSFDDEGNPQRKTKIIKKGIFKNYLFDQLYASMMKRKSTGNGIRQRLVYPLIDDKYLGQPVNQTSNLMILPGKKKIEDLISEIDRGMIVYRFSWLTPSEESGAFSSEIRSADYIENGEITRPVKGGLVSGNIFDMLKNVSGISKEFEIVSGSHAFCGVMPYGRFENMQVAGR